MINMLSSVRRKLYIHAESVYPEECCGFLFGAEVDGFRKIIDSLDVPNSEGTRLDHRFLITPKHYRMAEEHARNEGMRLLGFYHSHPDHKALPTQYDLENGIPWFLSVIISVTGGTASHMTAWIMNDSRMRYDQQSMLVL
ncbi:MAG TPA: M67 family metallopeptidase [Bacteroidota bacterium]|jgi:proteasome lid subunit RPN8/RPN11|nr:M67 family metallopeptidase [Bacteroidota bacterium]